MLPPRSLNAFCRPVVVLPIRRALVTAPRAGSPPLLERRNDRALPDLRASRQGLYLSIPLFLAAVGASALAIFNYQKSSSSVVSSTLYALRVNPEARKLLGDEIMFASKFPWIKGELNQFGGLIDISYHVKGTKAGGRLRFKSVRPTRRGYFQTEVWELELEDGRMLSLLEDPNHPNLS